MEKSKSLLNPKAAPYIPLSAMALASTPTSSSGQTFQYDVGESSIAGIQSVSIKDTEPSSSEDMCDIEEYIMGNFIQSEEHLVNLFPGISKESLADVFYCNDGDLEDTIAMLEELESDVLANENAVTSDGKGSLESKSTEATEKGSS